MSPATSAPSTVCLSAVKTKHYFSSRSVTRKLPKTKKRRRVTKTTTSMSSKMPRSRRPKTWSTQSIRRDRPLAKPLTRTSCTHWLATSLFNPWMSQLWCRPWMAALRSLTWERMTARCLISLLWSWCQTSQEKAELRQSLRAQLEARLPKKGSMFGCWQDWRPLARNLMMANVPTLTLWCHRNQAESSRTHRRLSAKTVASKMKLCVSQRLAPLSVSLTKSLRTCLKSSLESWIRTISIRPHLTTAITRPLLKKWPAATPLLASLSKAQPPRTRKDASSDC